MKDVTIIVLIKEKDFFVFAYLRKLISLFKDKYKILIVKNDEEKKPRIDKFFNNKNLSIKIIRLRKKKYFSDYINKIIREYITPGNDILVISERFNLNENVIEELVDVLYACDRHAIACPRGTSAPWAKFPIDDNNGSWSIAQSYKIHSYIRDLLPRFSVIPATGHECLLIRYEIAIRLGLFDEKLDLPDCMVEIALRYSQYGYSTIMANRVIGFSNFKGSLAEVNLLGHNYYKAICDYYSKRGYHPIDYFADIIDLRCHQKKKVLFCLLSLFPQHNGTSEFNLSLLKEFNRIHGNDYDISVLVNKDAAKFHDLKNHLYSIYYPENISGKYHLAFVPSQLYRREHLVLLNRHCLRIVFCLLDIIAMRCMYMFVNRTKDYETLRESICWSDGIITISNYSKEDAIAFFGDRIKSQLFRTIHLTVDHKFDDNINGIRSPNLSFFLVVGHDRHHKALRLILPLLENNKNRFVIIGLPKNASASKNILLHNSGYIKTATLDYLYRYCEAVIFPSQYEGYGLPIAHALINGKKIILQDNPLHREIIKLFTDDMNRAFFFNNFDDIPSLLTTINIIDNSKKIEGSNNSIRTWSDIANEVESFFCSVINSDIDSDKLIKRWEGCLKYEEQIDYNYKDKNMIARLKNKIVTLFNL